jgi:hypothetical protein
MARCMPDYMHTERQLTRPDARLAIFFLDDLRGVGHNSSRVAECRVHSRFRSMTLHRYQPSTSQLPVAARIACALGSDKNPSFARDLWGFLTSSQAEGIT